MRRHEGHMVSKHTMSDDINVFRHSMSFFIFEYSNSFSRKFLRIHAAESPTCKRASEMSAVMVPAIVIADRVQTNVSDDLRRESPSDSGSISSRLR